MEKKYSSKSISSNFLWRFFERCGAQGVTFIVSIILARILGPDAYGTVALITAITTILETFIVSGIGTALIQKHDADDLDYSSVFYFNIICGVLLYIGMFFSASLIADFYERPELTELIRVVSLTLIISALKNVQHAYVSKNMLFKRFFFSTLIGTISAAAVGITLAICGFGVWAIVIQSLLNHTMDAIILWITVKWRPIKAFSFQRLKVLYSFGWKLLASSLIDRIYKELRTMIIGKRYSSEDLAFYNRGQSFPRTVITNINSSIDSVLLPTMASAQDNVDRLRSMTRRSIRVSTYLIMPIMMGLAVCAEQIVRILLTDTWISCVYFLRIFCFTFAFYPLHTANLNAIKALGRSDLFLKLEIIKKIVGIIALLCTMFISVKAMALSALFTSILSQIINSWPNRELLDYHYGDQLKDMMPQIGLSCFMGAAVYCVQFLHLNDWITLLIQVPLGAAIYIAGSRLFRLDSYNYILGIGKGYLHKYK